VTDTTGSVATEYTYDSFGSVSATDPTFANPFQFTGRENAGLAGLYYYRARYYSSVLQRFLSEDPVGFQSGQINAYVYVANEPLNLIDPLGLASLRTDMTRGTTTFDPRPEDPNGQLLTIPTRNAVDRSISQPGADDPFSTLDVTPVELAVDDRRFGPAGPTYIRVNDPRNRDIHGGGSGLLKEGLDPYAPRQGWKPTAGCTRGQNEDVQALSRRIRDFKSRHPGVKIPYDRFR